MAVLREWMVNLLTAVIQFYWLITWKPESWQRAMNYQFNIQTPNAAPGEDTFIRGRSLGVISEGEYSGGMGLYGYSPGVSEIIYKSSLRYPDASTAIALFFRGEISLETLELWLKGNGYGNFDLAKLVKAHEHFPSASDLIAMAVREAYSPEAISLFRTLEGLPSEFVEDAKKIGISREWAEKYWIAHWRLPSVEQGFEMLHRGIISWEELDILLKALDIMPYFREKLRAISYRPYTRVDARRMYAMGVLTEEEVLKTFMDLGYDREHAAKMTEWVKLSAVEDVKSLTKSQIGELYESGDLTRDEAFEMLQMLGYEPKSASLLLSLYEHEVSRKDLNANIDSIKQQFIAGQIDEAHLHDELARLGLTGTRLRREIASAVRAKRADAKLPTKDDLLKWLRLGLIQAEEYFEKMRLLGYSHEDSLRYIASDIKLPSKSDLDKWVKARLITIEEYAFYLRLLKYSEKDIEKFTTLIMEEMGVV